MIVGHYATALVAKQQQPAAPLWFFLLASNFQDFLMLVLVIFGVERLENVQELGVPIISTVIIDMTYSHDILPVIGWTVLFAILGFAVTRTAGGAIWGGAMVVIHELCDLVSGFPHYIFGPDTAEVGMGLYRSFPLLALGVELLLSIACVWWFTTKMNVSPRNRIILYVVIISGVVSGLPFFVGLPFMLPM